MCSLTQVSCPPLNWGVWGRYRTGGRKGGRRGRLEGKREESGFGEPAREGQGHRAQLGRAPQVSPRVLVGAQGATRLLDSGASLRPSGNSQRSPSWCPGRATESRAHPRFQAAHPEGTGKSLILRAFSLLEKLVSNHLALAGAKNVVRKCSRQLSQSRAAAL